MAGPEAWSVADGTDRPDAAAGRAADRLGDEPARLADRVPGVVLDRPDSAVRRAARAGSAIRRRRPESARRGDEVAGERQVLPLLHLRLHPVPVPQRGASALTCSPRRT